jgi:hypothetical protein
MISNYLFELAAHPFTSMQSYSWNLGCCRYDSNKALAINTLQSQLLSQFAADSLTSGFRVQGSHCQGEVQGLGSFAYLAACTSKGEGLVVRAGRQCGGTHAVHNAEYPWRGW